MADIIPGILCGKIAAVDIDVTDKEIAEQLKDYALQICGETVYRIGKAPKVLLGVSIIREPEKSLKTV